MKILMVTVVYGSDLNGAARFVSILQSQKQWDVTVLTENVGEAPNLKSVDVDLNWWSRKLGMLSRINLYKARLAAIASDYDVILLNHPLLAYKLQVHSCPTVVFVHDYESGEVGLPTSKQQLVNRAYRCFEKRALREPSIVLANSNYTAKYLEESHDVPAAKIRILHQSYVAGSFAARHLVPDSPISILFVKNDYKRGGLLDLVQALSSLTDYAFRLTVVGCTPTLPSATNVTYWIKGGLPHEQVLELMQSHDIYCVPSRREALGVANMEAMASGIPVVTTDAGGIPEVITEREGYICKPHDPQSLAAAVLRCIEDEQGRPQKVMRAREKVEQFSKERMIAKLQVILEEAVAKHSR